MLRRISDPDEIRLLEELKAKRKSLWRRFESHPNEIHLAATLKIIDDHLAQFNLQSGRDANKIDDSGVLSVPEVGGIFLLLALSQHRVSKPDSAHSPSRDSTSEYANDGPPRLEGQAASNVG